jgi:hypothetical protein
MQRFEDDDDGYLAWVAAHPIGFVINTERTPRPAYIVLHRATCRSISGDPARGHRWTHDYIKVCGDRGELEEFAIVEVGGAAQGCGLCI